MARTTALVGLGAALAAGVALASVVSSSTAATTSIAVRATPSLIHRDSRSISVPTPATLHAHDVLVAVVAERDAAGDTLSAPASWTLVGQSRTRSTGMLQSIYVHEAQAGDARRSVFRRSRPGAIAETLLVFDGADARQPLSTLATWPTPRVPSAVAPRSRSRIGDLLVLGYASRTATPRALPAGMHLRAAISTRGGPPLSLSIASLVVASGSTLPSLRPAGGTAFAFLVRRATTSTDDPVIVPVTTPETPTSPTSPSTPPKIALVPPVTVVPPPTAKPPVVTPPATTQPSTTAPGTTRPVTTPTVTTPTVTAPPVTTPTVTAPPSTTPPAAGTLLNDSFSYPDGLLTNEYAFFDQGADDAVDSDTWQLDSGSLFAKGGAGWTGVPDDIVPNARSTNGNDSAIFRLVTKRADFGNVSVSLRLDNTGLVSTGSTPAVDWDGVHIFLRYQSEFSLYYASINRRDNKAVIKKKVKGGPDNGGTYYELSDEVSHTVAYNTWQDVKATVRTNADGSVTIALYSGGTLVVQATDTGVGGPPITSPGRVGLRGDNSNFLFDDFRVDALS